MAIKRAREREISFKHILSKNWPTITKPLVYTLLAGIFLGIYLLTWQGGLLFIFIIFAYLVLQFIVDHLRHKSSDYLCIVGIPLFLIAFLMLLPILGGSDLDTISRVSLPIAIVATIVLSIISRLMAGRTLKPVYYPLTLLGLAGIGLAALHAINPSLLKSMLDKFSIFTPAGAMLTVMEVHPLTLEISWANFNTSFFISFISFAMLIYVAIKEKSADKILFLVWSIIMLAAVFGQRRFGYYYVINAALLTGYFSWRMLDIAGLRRLLAKPKEVVGAVKQFKKKGKKAKGKAKPKTFMQPRGAWVNVIIVGIIIFFLVFFPSIGLWREEPTKIAAAGPDWFCIGYTRAVAEMPLVSMDEGWYTSLLWLKDINHSPEPFGDPNFYYERYLPRDKFQYPETAYGVMSWWDYGYFIMQIAHRLPNANPGQANADKAGQFFTAQNESSADKVADELGTKYVMIDSAMPTTKFYAMVEWAGGSVDKFFEYYWYYRTQTGSPMPVLLAYPVHYNSTVVRLYYFDGREQPGNDTLVVSYQEQVDSEGVHYKLISSAKLFSSYTDAQTYISSHGLTGYTIMGASPFGNTVIRYEEKVSEEGIHYEEITDLVFLPEPYYNYESAKAFIASQPIGNYKVLDPFISPVPLEGLEHYELRYSSDSLNTFTALGKQLPSVKIFEYLGSSQS